MKRCSTVIVVAALLLVVSVTSDIYAIAGVGIHYGLDFSMSMKDVKKDGLEIPNLGFDFDKVSIPGISLPAGLLPSGADANFLYVSREDWRRSFLNLGGKVFIDIIPFINTLELSGNFGIWQYEGAVHYLNVDSLGRTPALWTNPASYPYETRKLTLEEFNMSYFGLSGTPYAKFQLDLSARKNVFDIPMFKVTAGGGFTVNFATPILGSHLVDGVQVDKGYSPERMVSELSNPNSKIGEQIVRKILDELFTPRYGMHIVAGAHFKIPVAPVGFYADGKLMIPFSKFDENGEVKGLGVMFNIGAAFQL